jgi:hypothetical protein
MVSPLFLFICVSLKHSPLGTFSTSHVAVTFPELAFYAISITGKSPVISALLAIPSPGPGSHSLLRRWSVRLVGRR